MRSTAGKLNMAYTSDTPFLGRHRLKYSLSAIIAVSLVVGACSQVPDWANPVEIYEDVTGQNSTEASTQSVSDTDDEEFPNLADVPEQRTPLSDAEKDEVRSGLAADRSQAAYSEEVLVGGTSRAAPPPAAEVEIAARAAPSVSTKSEPVEAPAATVQPAAKPVVKKETTPTVNMAESSVDNNTSGEIGRVNWNSRKKPVPSRLSEETRTKADLAKVKVVEDTSVADNAPAPVEKPMPAQSANASTPSPAKKPVTLDERTEPVQMSRTELPKSVAPVVAPAPATVDANSVTDVYQQMLMQSSATRVAGQVNQGFNSPSSMQFPQEVAALVPPTIAATLNSPVSAPSLNLGYQVDPSSSVTVDPTVLGDSAANQAATIHFNNGSANLSGADRRVLRQVAETLRNKGGFLRIVGHASSRTKNMQVEDHLALNKRISERRARAVARELSRLGVSSELILVEARGDSEPIYFESMPAGEAGNRRVEIFHEV